MTCHNCRIDCRKFGKRKNRQRYQCTQCEKVFTDARDNTLEGIEITQGRDLLRLQKELADAKAENFARTIQAVATWATDVSVKLEATKILLNKVGVTRQEWQQTVDEARRSLPQSQESSLPALAELLRKLSEQ